MSDMIIEEKLFHIQQELKAPKDLYNKFGGYHHRSAENIIESVKPLLKKYECTLTFAESLQQCGVINTTEYDENGKEIESKKSTRVYICSMVELRDIKTETRISSNGYAREATAKKGMDDSQITGSTSSYAKKYALQNLFALDDTKDADATNTHEDKPQARKTRGKKVGNATKTKVKSPKKDVPFVDESVEDLQGEIKSKIIRLHKDKHERFDTKEKCGNFLRDKTGKKNVKKVDQITNPQTLRNIKEYLEDL